MRKNFIILLFTLISILPNFSYANQDVINQINYQRFLDSQLQGQLEYDRRRAQEAEAEAAAARQRQAQQPYVEPDINIVRSVFVWNDETGNCYYLPCASQEKGMFAKRAVVKRAKETYKKLYGEEANRHIDWDCGMAAITMGVSKKTGKIEAYVDTDIKAWIKKYGENDPDILDKVNQDALDYCSTQADNCQLMYGTYDIPDNK
ncbi:hypothetical protein EII28_11135 [Fusobacterium nucleatum]|uniref:Uncharacterized protein n=1 Tax=Fusobacterium nucleatum TaxID=851 RepID=A0A3P1VMR2_FUSNU|nr:hypothetical protein [Fusobacterium nucleatum]RRD34857.1 hypothetical protein EII28_11135 [Fusobacterium nucleatum]